MDGSATSTGYKVTRLPPQDAEKVRAKLRKEAHNRSVAFDPTAHGSKNQGGRERGQNWSTDLTSTERQAAQKEWEDKGNGHD